MKRLFNDMTIQLMTALGDVWTTTRDGESVTFRAILDDEEQYNLQDGPLQDKTRLLAITVLTTTADGFADNQVVTDDDGTTYQVRERVKQGDGQLTLCRLVEVSRDDC